MTRTELARLRLRTEACATAARDLDLVVHELQQCHQVLDELGAPTWSDNVELSLIGRIRGLRRGTGRKAPGAPAALATAAVPRRSED